MNQLNEITDKEFIPFLTKLGVDTYNKSFEWMLNDSDFSEVLRWLYENLDHNNALTPREQYRYSEIKRQNILSETDLESSIKTIQAEYEGICLPGESDQLADVKLDIIFQQEKLQLLERQEKLLQDLIKKNETIKDEVAIEVTHLHEVQQQCTEDEKSASEECLALAEDVEAITEEVMDIVTEKLNLIGRTQSEKDIAKMFFTFGPFEAYHQLQAQFHSHFDLYASKMSQMKQNIELSDEKFQNTLAEAMILEERLSDAAYAYIESKAELAGILGKLDFVSSYTPVHQSQIMARSMESESGLAVATQQLQVLQTQAAAAVTALCSYRRQAVADAVTGVARAHREALLSAAAALASLCARALPLDRCVAALSRAELRALAELVNFAGDLCEYAAGDARARRERTDSMNKIIAEQALCEEKLQSNDFLLATLAKILGLSAPADVPSIVKLFKELKLNVRDLKFAVEEKYRKKEENIEEIKKSTLPLCEFALSGNDTTIGRLTHTLRQEMAALDTRVIDAGAKFNEVKSGDNLRKLWQWFLAEPARLQFLK